MVLTIFESRPKPLPMMYQWVFVDHICFLLLVWIVLLIFLAVLRSHELLILSSIQLVIWMVVFVFMFDKNDHIGQNKIWLIDV
jgi:hypothetical protein